jgi:hypothetical protein
MAQGAGKADSFSAAAAPGRQRQHKVAARLQTAREKEKAKMDAFMSSMGIKADGPRIVIKPRQL